MKLTAYLNIKKIDRQEFAKAIGVDPITLYRWEKGKRFPRKHIQKIMEATKNKVTANDFIGEANG